MPTIQKQHDRRTLWYILLGALLLRLVLAVTTKGYPYDMSCFVAWGDKLASEGPAAFYSEGYFADYPPGYLLVLGLVGLVRKAFSIPYEAPLTYLLLVLVPALCDCAATALVWLVGEKTMRPGGQSRALTCITLFTAFCPLTLYDTGVWKQIDGAFALPLLLCFLLLEGKRYLPAALCYGVALAIKPQALLAGPVLALCFLIGILEAHRQGGAKAALAAVGKTLGGAALALCPPLLAGLPFYGVQGLFGSLFEKYIGTSSSYPYASINAFNWFEALGGNWVNQNELCMGLVSWETLGILNIGLVTVGLVYFAVRSWQRGRFSPLLLAGYYIVAIFTFAHCMHERYLLPGVLLVLLAAVRWNDIRLYGAAFGLSLTGLFNLATVYTLVDTEDEFLTSATTTTFARLVGFAQTACCLLLIFTVYDLVIKGGRSALAKPAGAGGSAPRRSVKKSAATLTAIATPAPQPEWQRPELLALLGLTLATGVLSFTYLGAMTAPQTPVDATGQTLQMEFTPGADATALWVYPGISNTGSVMRILDAAGNELYTQELGYTATFAWDSAALSLSANQTYAVQITDGQVFELALHAADGALVPVSGGEALFDEQGAVPEKISQLNSMYFDEIYHGRTGYEMLHQMTVYETTHPPLGKDFIMLGIAIFGMTGFGWRCAGTLFGVLLVPLAWCFARRLTRKPWLGAVAGALLALDFMRFSQSRIATIDVYGTFFILLGAYFMLWYCQSVLEKGVCASILPMALGGIAFGLGCASKWTGIYNGAGLAVFYLGVLYLRYRQKQPAFGREFRTAALGGVGFYILTPLAIYIGSYFPYWLKNPAFTLKDWWACQTSMYDYHSTLVATHPFESRWYTWLLGLRPVWYYQNSESVAAGYKASIAGLAGPVIWIAGLFCILLLFWRQVSARGTRAGAGVLILYATQLVPWMMVSRCTFLYHYFPSSIFCLMAIVLVLSGSKNQIRAKRLALGLCVLALGFFIWYYPALSGLPVPEAWAQSLQWPGSFGFY